MAAIKTGISYMYRETEHGPELPVLNRQLDMLGKAFRRLRLEPTGSTFYYDEQDVSATFEMCMDGDDIVIMTRPDGSTAFFRRYVVTNENLEWCTATKHLEIPLPNDDGPQEYIHISPRQFYFRDSRGNIAVNSDGLMRPADL